MNFDERLAQTQAKMDDLKAKINETLDTKKEDREAKRANALDKINAFVSDPDALNKVFEKIDEKIETAIVEGMDSAADAIDGLDGKIDRKVDEQVEAIEGDFFAAKEDMRISQEKYESKLNADRLEIQMRLEAARDKIRAKRDSVDKGIQEEAIMELLDYADMCQEIAYSYANEAQLAVLDACDMIDKYEKKYGKFDK